MPTSKVGKLSQEMGNLLSGCFLRGFLLFWWVFLGVKTYWFCKLLVICSSLWPFYSRTFSSLLQDSLANPTFYIEWY